STGSTVKTIKPQIPNPVFMFAILPSRERLAIRAPHVAGADWSEKCSRRVLCGAVFAHDVRGHAFPTSGSTQWLECSLASVLFLSNPNILFMRPRLRCRRLP